MLKKNIVVALSLVATLYAGITLNAGGVLETVDITGNIPSPIPGQILGRVIGLRWDVRAIPVQYRLNDSFANVPNPLGGPVLTLSDADAALQASFDAWNSLPTSYHRPADRRPGDQRRPGGLRFRQRADVPHR